MLEGSVRVTLVNGSERTLGPGVSRWVVEDHVRKLVLHDTRSRVRRALDRLR